MLTLAPDLVVADRFRLVRKLGAGGMGAVWLAHHTALDVPCAVKFVHEHVANQPEIRVRFEREAKSAAALRSPHVVGILDHGVFQGIPYMAMEFLEGEDLGDRLARKGRLEPVEIVTIVSHVARALSRAEALGLVHRDLKPANIFLAIDDDREIAKVLDFGIAKMSTALAIGDSSTKTGTLLGTPFYMSPEQAQGNKVIDHRSDLWSLGVVVFKSVVGELPFHSEALGDLLMKIMVNPIPVPSQYARVPPAFDAWFARAAARDPSQRFQNAKEFADGLSSALGPAPLAGLPLSTPGHTAQPAAGPPYAPGFHATPSGPSWPQPAPVGFTPTPGTLALPHTPVPTASTPPPGALPAAMGATQNPVAVPARAPKRSNTAVVASVVGGVLALGVAVAVFASMRGSSSPSAAPASAAAEPVPSTTPFGTGSPPVVTAATSAAPEAPSAEASSSAAPEKSASPAQPNRGKPSRPLPAKARPAPSAGHSPTPTPPVAKPPTDYGI